MQIKKLKLTERWVHYLRSLPESGMGFRNVKIFLHDGNILHHRTVLNSSSLLFEEHENFTEKDIKKIELELKGVANA